MSYNSTLKQGSVGHHLGRAGLDMAKLHDVDGIVDRHIDATHHALVVTKEEDGETADAVDGDEKPAPLVAVDDIVFGYPIHL